MRSSSRYECSTVARRTVQLVEDAHPVEDAAVEQELEEPAHLVGRPDHVSRRHDPGEEADVVRDLDDLAVADAERAPEAASTAGAAGVGR